MLMASVRSLCVAAIKRLFNRFWVMEALRYVFNRRNVENVRSAVAELTGQVK
jgi:hypothetical protein